jgi:DNA recombination protein RmuC
MSTLDFAVWAPLMVSVALLIGVIILLRRPTLGVTEFRELLVQTRSLKLDLERIERTIRDNDSRSFNSAEDRGKALRAEVSEAIGHSAATLVTSLSAVGDAQKGQLESFAAALKSVGEDLRHSAAQSTELQKGQLDSFAKQLTEGVKSLDERMEALRQLIDQKITALLEGIATRFEAAKEANSAAARALREEVQTTLKAVGDDLRRNGEVASSAQNERFEQVSRKLVELGDSIGQRFETYRQATEAKLTEMRQDASMASKQLREEVTNSLNKVGEDLRENAKRLGDEQRLSLDGMGKRISEIGDASQRTQEKLRESVAEGLRTLRQENEQKLEQMRQTVDEKLQGTLEKRLGESFSLVSQQLRQVHEGLGDMQKLATGVGDLKRVLTNVKSRGTWGETQLAAILEDMLAPDQYLRNVQAKDGSSETVEFCVKIPLLDEHQEHVLLPIDAKFPMEDYERLMAAAENGDPAGTEQAAQKLEARFRSCAKDIAAKYISPPRTTEYAVMYVPSEGLYAEIVKRPGVLSAIAREFNVVIAGPTNLLAILNAVHAVSRSVTIQHKAGEIAALLLKVQNEFVKYGEVVSLAKKRAESTVKAMEKLDTRQRAMGKALKGVKSIEGIAVAVQLPAPILELSAGEAQGIVEELDYVDDSEKMGEEK